MVTFKISGSLPAAWEDFFSQTAGVPNISIYTRDETAGFEDAPSGGSDGWLDIVVDCRSICIDVARLAIAEALGIENPEHVCIVEAGLCRSI